MHQNLFLSGHYKVESDIILLVAQVYTVFKFCTPFLEH